MTLPYANSATKGHEPDRPEPFEMFIEDTKGLSAGVSLQEICLASVAISLKRIADILDGRIGRG